MPKSINSVFLTSLIFILILNLSHAQNEEPTCSSRVISLVPKTMKYHNQINNTKQLTCKSASLPNFAALDQRCYLIISPSGTGDFQISVDMTVKQKKPNGPQSSISITLPFVLTITKIRYNGKSQQQVQYDISLNRIINIETQSHSWLVKPGQDFFAQFKVNETPKLYQRIYFQFNNLPNGLKGNQLTGVIEGSIQVPRGYYSFAIRVFDLQGNSQTLQATMLVHDDKQIFQQEDLQDQDTLKARLAAVDQRIADNAALISDAKNNIEKKLELIAVARAQISDLNAQQRKLQGTQKSLAYAMNWTKGNLQTMKKRFQSAEQIYNDYNLIVNDAKRAYQTSVFAIQEKQSQIQKEQLEADRRFELYLQGDRNYTQVRIQRDQCERKNKQIANDAMSNLKELDRANFVQNLYDIIQSK